MTDPENFLRRWSRKKTEATREPEDRPAADVRTGDEASPLPLNAESKPLPAATKPAFDLSKLPSLDSITSASDVRAFLMPGVPPELTRAALRRAWTADPAIRDFVGLSENAWDFTDPSAMPGFGDIPVGYDLKKMVAEVFGELEQAAEPATESRTQVAQLPENSTAPTPSSAVVPTAGSAEPAPSPTERSRSREDFVQRDSHTAPQNSNARDEPQAPKTSRAHGRALPKV
jgi:hypothetical protein